MYSNLQADMIDIIQGFTFLNRCQLQLIAPYCTFFKPNLMEPFLNFQKVIFTVQVDIQIFDLWI